ncbi:MAG: 1-acyl-sn-glycerol-3-phosphate acyltransferase [Bacteroidales bacterium]|nr:1-acyl-sn-glycerol-3-phosphate acyltransferase [Bacteroidales bacterium]
MNFSEKILRLFGWKVYNDIGVLPIKSVVIAAPHTSMWDFVWGYLFFRAVNLKGYFLIKEEAFFFPLGGFLRKLGGIPVKRNKKNNVVEDVVELFNEADEMALTLTPEATRGPVKTWKNGYHKIAKRANVPVILGSLDYEKREAGVLAVYDLQGDSDYDTLQIMKFFVGRKGKYPENFYLPPEVLNGEV